MSSDAVLRRHLVKLLNGGEAHMVFDQAVANFPPEQINRFPPQVPYSPWHLLEHLRIAQRDILDFIRDPSYVSPPWPEGYWPSKDAETDEAGWVRTIDQFRQDLKSLEELAMDPATDLESPIPHGQGQTILREILVVSDHNAYHLGEFAILRQVMGSWR